MNPVQAKTSYILRILRGYRHAALALFRLLLILITAAALSCIIVWPLWYTAVHSPRLFSALTLLVLPLVLIALGWRKARQRGYIINPAELRRKIGRFLVLLFCVFLFLTAVFLFLSNNPGLGTILALGCIHLAGHLAFGRPSRT